MKRFVLFATVLLAFCSAALAQSTQVVSQVTVIMPKAGMVKQFEEGRKAHSAFHGTQKDTWKVFVWEVSSGERSGAYVMASPGHNWKEFDGRAAFDKLDGVDVAKNMAPYAASSVTSYYVYREDMSMTPPPAMPANMRTTVAYTVDPAHVNDFIEAVKKINAALKKTNYPVKPSRWYALANGGEHPTFVLVTDRATWADMEPPEKKLEDALTEADGDTSALDTLRKSTRRIVSEMSVFRPDLSYIPK